MKIYKMANGLYRIGNYILPAGSCKLELRDDDRLVTLTTIISDDIVFNEYIDEVEDEAGTTYANIEALIDVIKDFFLLAGQNSGGGNPPSTVEFISGTVDNFSLLPDATINDEKFFVTMHDVTVGGANKPAGIYLSRGDAWKRAVKFTNVN